MAKKFELYGIASNFELLSKLRSEYIRTMEHPIVSKVITSNQDWFYYRQGIYDVSKMIGNAFFEMTFIPVVGYTRLVDDYISFGSSNGVFLKAIRYEGEDIFMYAPCDINKNGRTFTTKPVIRINEDLYNIGKIIAREFGSLTISDLSKYKSFLNISEEPYMIIDEARIEDLYRTHQITLEEYKKQIESYELEEELVKTLRK